MMKTIIAIIEIVKDAINRLDLAFVGKVARISAAICVIEFLVTIAVTMLVPACSAASPNIQALMIPIGALAIWTSIIAYFGTDERHPEAPRRFSFRLIHPDAVVLTATFSGFPVAGAIMIIAVIQQCR
jgi:hypothetical protein